MDWGLLGFNAGLFYSFETFIGQVRACLLRACKVLVFGWVGWAEDA